MKLKNRLSAIFVILVGSALCANAGVFIDTVYSFTPGKGQNFGQGVTFPANIFGAPDTSARFNVPASSPETILSLGEGGEIIVGLKNGEITDGPGPDFTIFENAFKKQVDSMIFAEPGLVSVSEDGVNFVAFTFDSCSFTGAAGITPTYGDKDAFNPAESGGDSFDLATLGLKSVKYIKIKDIAKLAAQKKGCPYFSEEFLISGFDLDAVAILNYHYFSTSVSNNILNTNIFENSEFIKIVSDNAELTVAIFDVNGILQNSYLSKNIMINKREIPTGVYFIKISTPTGIKIYKFITN